MHRRQTVKNLIPSPPLCQTRADQSSFPLAHPCSRGHALPCNLSRGRQSPYRPFGTRWPGELPWPPMNFQHFVTGECNHGSFLQFKDASFGEHGPLEHLVPEVGRLSAAISHLCCHLARVHLRATFTGTAEYWFRENRRPVRLGAHLGRDSVIRRRSRW